ncbi:MAG: hypothetical protein EHM87_19595 [Burkholderiales bacterium]|nr:MAG: hypothetical protein EHM87_19595 [Burkholderiales bacterium]
MKDETDITDVFNIEAQNKKLSDEQKRARQQQIDDVKEILKLSAGRRYFWRLLGECGIFHSSFSPNSNQTAFNEGRREVGLGMLIDINAADFTVFAKMQNEYLSALNSKKQAKEAKDARPD